jgi:hypothetical protein
MLFPPLFVLAFLKLIADGTTRADDDAINAAADSSNANDFPQEYATIVIVSLLVKTKATPKKMLEEL